MRLGVIKDGIEGFIKRLSHARTSPIAWMYQKQEELESFDFQNHFDDFIHQLFSSENHVRYWKRDDYRPAEVLTKLAETENQNLVLAFSLLYDHTKTVDTRIDQFRYFLDQLLVDRKSNDLGFNESATFQDTACLSYYLTMRHGSKYTLYRHDVFQKAMQLLSPEKPITVEDYTRYLKVCKIVENQLSQNEEVDFYHNKRFDCPPKFRSLLTYEYLHFLTETNYY